MVFYKGSNWFSLNKKTVDEILKFIANNDWFLKIFSKSLCGDEVFFHTLLKYIGVKDIFHGPERINDILRYIDWTTGPEYPRILNASDLDRIKKSGSIFARKFPQHVDADFLDNLLNRS